MAIQTIDLKELERDGKNIYEACLIIAKRAREINGDRISKRKEKEILEESGYDQEMDVYDREFFEGIEHEKETNPTVIAQEELLDGKLNFRYLVDEENELDEKPSE